MSQSDRLLLLADSIRDDLLSLQKIREKISELQSEVNEGNSYINRSALALTIHNFYNCLENIFTSIASEFGNEVSGESWHIDILRRMKLDRKSIRPAVIDEELFSFLNNIRGFRHVVRHSYDYDLDYRRILLLVEDIEKYYDRLIIKIEDFVAFIQQQANNLENES